VKNDGKEAERAFESYWERRGHLERLRDKKDLMGLNKGTRLADFKKPADYLVSSKVDPLHYAEVKSTTDGKSFAFSKIQEGQSAAALKSAQRGDGNYYFYIFSYALSQWFVMSCHQYRTILDEGRRSVKFEELEPWQK
jgi:penicillin-binding protein-related factor A (putative recombinase)